MTLHRFLVTGSNSQLQRFHLIVSLFLQAVDQMQQTILYACLQSDREKALEIARLTGVTIQEWNNAKWEIIAGPGPGWQPNPIIKE